MFVLGSSVSVLVNKKIFGIIKGDGDPNKHLGGGGKLDKKFKN